MRIEDDFYSNEEGTTTVRSDQEFSTIKLDLTSKAIVVDRGTGARQLQDDSDEREEDDDNFGEVVDVSFTILTDDVTESTAAKSNITSVDFEEITTTTPEELSEDEQSDSPTTSSQTTAETSTTDTPTTKAEETFRRIGFNKGSVQANPSLVSSSTATTRIATTATTIRAATKSIVTISTATSTSTIPDAIASAIPLLSHWIVDYISRDQDLSSKCSNINAVSDAINKVLSDNTDEDVDVELLASAESLAALMVHVINRELHVDHDKNKKDSKDSVHGDDVVRRNRRVRIRNRNFNSIRSGLLSKHIDYQYQVHCSEAAAIIVSVSMGENVWRTLVNVSAAMASQAPNVKRGSGRHCWWLVSKTQSSGMILS